MGVKMDKTTKVLYEEKDFRLVHIKKLNSPWINSVVVQHYHENLRKEYAERTYSSPNWSYCWQAERMCSYSHCRANVPKEIIALHILLTMDNKDFRT